MARKYRTYETTRTQFTYRQNEYRAARLNDGSVRIRFYMQGWKDVVKPTQKLCLAGLEAVESKEKARQEAKARAAKRMRRLMRKKL